MRRKKAFTMIEMLIVVAILGILVGVAVPSLFPAVEFSQKNLVNTMHKIGVNAIDSWVKANYDPVQRPDNFNSRNSQGVAVFEYITSSEYFKESNLIIEEVSGGSGRRKWVTVNPQSENKVYITFSQGILKTAFAENTTSPAKFEIEYKAYDFSISDYERRKQLNYIVGYENGTKSVTEYAEIKRR